MMRNITYCTHDACYEDCEFNILNVDDETELMSVDDRYGTPGCILYDIDHRKEEDEESSDI